ncbi:hypothetical protein F2Q65_09210 [Thiohalocapsa marina]|uniref:Rap1a immunity protein domain-containing protein n=1 Tax=Thiohalocapsa marina TaxID=424902 RepID=A0A5M8FKL5_9GAMM|nr:Rap1a/Tai family immunity protein [Thiohalocapsa marina]KAA6185269.1 hypothetical protein F2Q65_09210 [Thiohalocapsa marina]
MRFSLSRPSGLSVGGPITGPALVLALGLSLAGSAVAGNTDSFDFDTTEDLLTVCSVSADDAAHVPALLACRAFIEATVQYHDAVSDRKQLKRLVCYPKNTTIDDGRKAFVAWGGTNRDNAELMGELPVVGLVRALAAKYPCK